MLSVKTKLEREVLFIENQSCYLMSSLAATQVSSSGMKEKLGGVVKKPRPKAVSFKL